MSKSREFLSSPGMRVPGAFCYDCRMNRFAKLTLFATLAGGAALIGASSAAAQKNGTIEFVAHATPSGGVDEPVRGFPFFLLSESYGDIAKEAEANFPKPDMNTFIDGLDVSKELKEWMKKSQWVTFSGEDFIHKLKTDDVMNIPEFYSAYMERNSGDESAGFPTMKFKESEKTKDPEKYQKDTDQYKEAVRHYMAQVPESINGIDLNLADIDPDRKWSALTLKSAPQLHRRVMELAQGKYLVARTETNLQGEGFLPNVPPGHYWLSTLDMTANVGDARPGWDFEVIVRPGETTYTALTSVNTVQSPAHERP
jgi:hypothetical protein